MHKLILVFIMVISATFAHSASFKVAETGIVEGFFLGATASYTNRATLNFENGGTVSNPWLYNTDPSISSINFGIQEENSEVVLVNHIINTNDWWYSIDSFNNDNISHLMWYQIYLADGTPAIIARWEDIYGGGDLDFNDNVLLFTNITAIPEPPMLVLMLLGLMLMPFIKRKS